ncbi:MAG: dimethylsulfonioproprionate lyase family protein [Pseudomonadota bacterium]
MATASGEAFVQALLDDLSARIVLSLSPFTAALERALDAGIEPQDMGGVGSAPPGFDTTLAAADLTPAMKAALQAVAPALRWIPVLSQHPSVPPALSAGLQAGLVLGGAGAFTHHGPDTIRAGFFHLAPNLHYPLHSHEAVEFYRCLSGRVEIQHGILGEANPLLPGQLSVTPPNRVHALTTGPEGALLLFAWIGDVDQPIYWWEADAAGTWRRTRWIRGVSRVWERQEAEIVPPALLAAQA